MDFYQQILEEVRLDLFPLGFYDHTQSNLLSRLATVVDVSGVT